GARLRGRPGSAGPRLAAGVRCARGRPGCGHRDGRPPLFAHAITPCPVRDGRRLFISVEVRLATPNLLAETLLLGKAYLSIAPVPGFVREAPHARVPAKRFRRAADGPHVAFRSAFAVPLENHGC